MGKKKYFCDFCNRYFNDDKNTRTKHLNSLGHINLKKEHYNMFRDPEIVLKEELNKKPCRKFHCEGFCPFGGSCTFSHYSKSDLDAINQEIYYKKQKELEKPSIEAWIIKYNNSLLAKEDESKRLLWSNQLPLELVINMSSLPPSLVPYHIQEVINFEVGTWG